MDGDQEVILKKYRPVVQRAARRLVQRIPPNAMVSFDDLESEGIIALMSCIKRFNPGHGVTLGAFCRPRVYGAMLDYLRRVDCLPRTVRPKKNAEQAELESHAHEQGYVPRRYDAIAGEHFQWWDGLDVVAGDDESPSLDLLRQCVQMFTDRRTQCVLAWHYGLGMTLSQVGEQLGIASIEVSRLKAEALNAIRLELETSNIIRYLTGTSRYREW